MTKRIFLIGHPVGHSVSPALQQAALDHYAMDVRYEAMDVEVLSLSQAVSNLRDPDVMGANITVPHKQAVIALIDELDEEARLIGAVNTIENRDGALIGHNTDAKGFLKALKEESGFDPEGKTALVLGAGGAARAVVVALAGTGVKSIVVANRTLERAAALIDTLRSTLPSAEAIVLNPDSLGSVTARSQLIVNCTSLGMSGGDGQGQTPMTADLIPSQALICDLVYNPRETPFMSEATKVAARVLGGLPMLVYQGAAAFELWTGRESPVKVMFEAAEKALMARQPVES
jgi:shikimate dehydrogenase